MKDKAKSFETYQSGDKQQNKSCFPFHFGGLEWRARKILLNL
jgi:hypothetical protein